MAKLEAQKKLTPNQCHIHKTLVYSTKKTR